MEVVALVGWLAADWSRDTGAEAHSVMCHSLTDQVCWWEPCLQVEKSWPLLMLMIWLDRLQWLLLLLWLVPVLLLLQLAWLAWMEGIWLWLLCLELQFLCGIPPFSNQVRHSKPSYQVSLISGNFGRRFCNRWPSCPCSGWHHLAVSVRALHWWKWRWHQTRSASWVWLGFGGDSPSDSSSFPPSSGIERECFPGTGCYWLLCCLQCCQFWRSCGLWVLLSVYMASGSKTTGSALLPVGEERRCLSRLLSCQPHIVLPLTVDPLVKMAKCVLHLLGLLCGELEPVW